MNDKLRGSVSVVSAVAFYGLFGTLAKFVGPSFGAFTQNWVRNGLVAAFILFFVLITGQTWKKIQKKDFKWMLAWTLTGSLNTILIFVAFNKIPIGTVYFLLYSSMIATGFVGGKIFFKEKITTQKLFCLGLAFLGLIIIYFLDLKSTNPVYVVLPILAGVMVGLWNVLSKKVSDSYPNSQLIFIDAIVSIFVAMIGGLLLSERIPTIALNVSWMAIVLWAVINLAATGLAIYGFKHLDAQIAAVILPLEVIFGTLFGFLFFGQILPTTTLIGGLMIASAAAIASLKFSDSN